MDIADKSYNILTLSDYSLLHIFTYVSSSDLYNLSLTCKRFEGLVKEKMLWQLIDSREGVNDKEKVNFCIDRVNERTKWFLVCSDRRDVQILPEDLFTSCAFTNLTVLALENQLIRGDLAKLAKYPKGLVELSLRKSFVHNHSGFFTLSYLYMENLKVLMLDECGWVETYMLVPMSKYPKLEVLSLFKCKKLSDSDIAYLSLAGCFGFKQLRVLDIRFTGLGDQILKTFYKHPTLHELYFQSYISTFALDRAKRRLEIARGSPIKPCAYFSDYDEIPDTNRQSMARIFGYHCYRTYRRQNLTSHGLVMFNFVVPNLDEDYELESVLYKPPYGECKCGYEDKRDLNSCKNEIVEEIHKKNKGKREEIMKLKNIIKEEKYKRCSPYAYLIAPRRPMEEWIGIGPYKNKTDNIDMSEEATEKNKQIYWIYVREACTQYEMAMFEHTDVHSLQSEAALPLDVMNSFTCDPTVIMGPSLDNPARENLSEESEDDDNEGDNMFDAENWISFEDTNILVDELLDEIHAQRNEQIRNGEVVNGEIVGRENGINGNPQNDVKTDKVEEDLKCEKESETDQNKKRKCETCNADVNDEETICKKCSGNNSGKTKVFRFKCGRSSKSNPASVSNDMKEPTPSTSTSHKRSHDNNSVPPSDSKKFKSNPKRGASNAEFDLNISCDVEDVNIKVNSPNMFFIDLQQPEQGVMNVPIRGGGLINILLGADGQTRTAIRKLSLRGYQKINDNTLDYLKGLKLDLLDITKTGVSRNAVAKFMRQNPTCRVLHESACTCLPNMHF
ncbi:f-box-like [Holotrichia oblita]|uniref:F-box-like n=1 Tax=Holotrichia oblita TaxID=644536 RepID=A0ACB9SJN4_HOLOL|nr:f-box-like [Holotrichia oblita]